MSTDGIPCGTQGVQEHSFSATRLRRSASFVRELRKWGVCKGGLCSPDERPPTYSAMQTSLGSTSHAGPVPRGPPPANV